MYRIVITVLLLALAAPAHAASLRTCFKCGTTTTVACATIGTVKVPLYVDGLKAVPDLLATGASQADGSVCGATSPIPTQVHPGTSQAYTITAVNSIGEESAPSGALTFLFPAVPAVPTLLSVGATTP